MNIDKNPVKNIINLFDYDKLKVIELLSEFDVIKGNKISEIKLLTVFDILNLTPPDNLYIEGYEII